MKRLLLNSIIFIFFLLPVSLFAQDASSVAQDITGLWKGALYNDTTKKFLPYEIAISEEKGKLTGYSYTLFDIDGKKELGVKKLKIKRKDNQLIIEDAELILNDYSEPPPRKVRQQSIVNILVNDTTIQLIGKWSTNQTREYRPLTGTIQVQRALNFRPLVLFKKLEELKLDNELSFVKPSLTASPDIAKNEKPADAIIVISHVDNRQVAIQKSKEVIALEPAKLNDVVVDNRIIAKEIKPSEEPLAKPVSEKSKEIALSPVEKKTVATGTGNEHVKKDEKATEQSVVKASTIIKEGLDNSPVTNKKSAVPVFKDSIGTVAKPNNDLVKKVEDKSKPITAPATEKKKEAIIATSIPKKENVQPMPGNPKSVVPVPTTKVKTPVDMAPAPAKKENTVAQQSVSNQKPTIVSVPVIEKQVPANTVAAIVKTESKAPVTFIPPPEKKMEVPSVIAAPIGTAAAANVAERKMNNTQSVFFESDSLVLTLYDNGEVDGDTVSVLMNGEILFAKQGLSTKANSKTIYAGKGMQDSLSLVMYAENLGSIPPNTGLLIIMDGEKRYEVRFSADLKTNAAILLRRKKDN